MEWGINIFTLKGFIDAKYVCDSCLLAWDETRKSFEVSACIFTADSKLKNVDKWSMKIATSSLVVHDLDEGADV